MDTFENAKRFNCRAGICGACETEVADGPNGEYKVTRICYQPVRDGARILTPDQKMMNFRQGTADEVVGP